MSVGGWSEFPSCSFSLVLLFKWMIYFSAGWFLACFLVVYDDCLKIPGVKWPFSRLFPVLLWRSPPPTVSGGCLCLRLVFPSFLRALWPFCVSLSDWLTVAWINGTQPAHEAQKAQSERGNPSESRTRMKNKSNHLPAHPQRPLMTHLRRHQCLGLDSKSGQTPSVCCVRGRRLLKSVLGQVWRRMCPVWGLSVFKIEQPDRSSHITSVLVFHHLEVMMSKPCVSQLYRPLQARTFSCCFKASGVFMKPYILFQKSVVKEKFSQQRFSKYVFSNSFVQIVAVCVGLKHWSIKSTGRSQEIPTMNEQRLHKR